MTPLWPGLMCQLPVDEGDLSKSTRCTRGASLQLIHSREHFEGSEGVRLVRDSSSSSSSLLFY